jgi:hypothetical protein
MCPLAVDIRISELLLLFLGVEWKRDHYSKASKRLNVSALDDDEDDGAIGGMCRRGNRSTRRKPAALPLCPPQTPHDQARAPNRATAVGRRPLTT